MFNLKPYTADEIASYFLQVDDTRQESQKLSPTEKERFLLYIIRSAYYQVGKDGLYLTKLVGDNPLHEMRKWSIKPEYGNPNYPDHMAGLFNPVPRLVDTDVAALMNEFTPEGITVYQEDGENIDEALTEKSRNRLIENDFYLFFQRLWTVAASQADNYVICRPDDTMQNGIRLTTMPGQCVFPVLKPDDRMTEAAFRIAYTVDVGSFAPGMEMFTESGEVDYLQIITPYNQQTTLDGDIVEDMTYEYKHPPLLPVVHFPFQVYDDYYGFTSFDCIMEDIDRINYMYSALYQMFRRELEPQILLTGATVGTKGFRLGETHVHEMPEGASATTLDFKLDTAKLTAIKDIIENVKEKIPHYSIFRQTASMASLSAESFNVRYGVFLSYEHKLERVQASNISKLINTMNWVAGDITRFRRVDVNLGPPISPGIVEQLAEVKAEIDTLGTSEVVIEKAVNRLGNYTPEEVEVIKQDYAQMKEAATKPKSSGNPIMDRINARRSANNEPA